MEGRLPDGERPSEPRRLLSLHRFGFISIDGVRVSPYFFLDPGVARSHPTTSSSPSHWAAAMVNPLQSARGHYCYAAWRRWRMRTMEEDRSWPSSPQSPAAASSRVMALNCRAKAGRTTRVGLASCSVAVCREQDSPRAFEWL